MDNMKIQKSVWQNEFDKIEFDFHDRSAIVVFPSETKPDNRWMLKTEYFDAFPQLEIELLRKGYALAYLKNINRWGINEDMDAKKDFAVFLHEQFGFHEKCVPVGMSCGGLHAIKLAARHPEMVSVLYLDAPVVNLLSCPFGFGVQTTNGEEMKKEALDALKLTKSEILSYREHPLDKLPLLIENHIPAVLVYGDSDSTVPFTENAAMVEKAYRNSGIDFLTICKKGCDHHPHGLEDPTEVIEFIIEHDIK